MIPTYGYYTLGIQAWSDKNHEGNECRIEEQLDWYIFKYIIDHEHLSTYNIK